MARDIAIRAVDLSKKFRSGDSELVVFANLNLEVNRGEQLALVGESGAGKTTLLHLLGGLDRPSGGSTTSTSGTAPRTRSSTLEGPSPRHTIL